MRTLLYAESKSGNASVSLIWEPRDVWVGVYWTHTAFLGSHRGMAATIDHRRVYICLLPFLPIMFEWYVPREGAGEDGGE